MFYVFETRYPHLAEYLLTEIDIYPNPTTEPSSKRIGVCNIQSAHDIDMLIGMDIIQLGDFHISNTDGKTRFSYIVPSLPERYSLAEEADKLNSR